MLNEQLKMHKGEYLDCKVLSVYDETFKYLEIFFSWNRILLDLNYLCSAGTLLNSEGQRV